MIVVGCAAAVLVVVLLFFQGDSPTAAVSRFMTALAKGDYKTLAQVSLMEGKSQQEIEEAWKYTVENPGKHYRFRFKILGDIEASQEVGSVRMQVWRNYDPGFSYEENFNMPVQRVDGRWKVDVAGISRKMYPGLPR